MRTADLDYYLPRELIATKPVEPRDAARMMVVQRSRDREETIEHTTVAHLGEFLQRGDLLIMNDSAVIPARFRARRRDTGGSVEGLFLSQAERGEWRVMLRSSSRLRSGQEIELRGHGETLTLRLLEREEMVWLAQPDTLMPATAVLAELGLTPLPPYIRKARGAADATDDELDRRWYQTVYADVNSSGSVAAPTAGLHFTPQLLEALDERGVGRETLTLHVGPGTFRPVAAERLEDHPMHEERYSIWPAIFSRIERVRSEGGRSIAVGTTTVRVLESFDAAPGDDLREGGEIHGSTRLLIAPPHEFRWVDGLLTNFHLPRSTLLALVAAMVGTKRLLELYEIAIAERYRFYSYGDCMLILP